MMRREANTNEEQMTRPDGSAKSAKSVPSRENCIAEQPRQHRLAILICLLQSNCMQVRREGKGEVGGGGGRSPDEDELLLLLLQLLLLLLVPRRPLPLSINGRKLQEGEAEWNGEG